LDFSIFSHFWLVSGGRIVKFLGRLEWSRGTVAGITELALPTQSGKHPAMRSPSWQFKRLTLSLVTLLQAAVSTAPGGSRPEIGSHIPRIEHPFALSAAQWQSLFAATTPGGQQLSAHQIAPLVLQQFWPAGTETRTNWHLKIGVFILAVSSDGTVSQVEILRSTGHPGIDRNVMSAFGKWRFRPNSVKEVRMPAYFTRSD
jgi:TonB family protein